MVEAKVGTAAKRAMALIEIKRLFIETPEVSGKPKFG